MTPTDATGYAAFVLALTAFVHAVRTALPGLTEAMRTRADSARLDSETRAAIEAARVEAEEDMRGRLDRCDAEHAATRAELAATREEYAHDIAVLRGQLAAMRDELEALRRSIGAGHGRSRY